MRTGLFRIISTQIEVIKGEKLLLIIPHKWKHLLTPCNPQVFHMSGQVRLQSSGYQITF